MPEDLTPTNAHYTQVPLPPTAAHHARESSGTVVAGRYTLLECVGEGGMGAVWSAKQTAPVKRLVAVKLIKAGLDSKGVLARFEAERQALAVMDHPNISKILDGGVAESGSPFFVMELVKGVPITQYCDERKLAPAQRLELFVPVCEAIQHAHQKGVIHRDIKPSNVLVAFQDGRPVPKVIDFGIAKATGPALTDLTLNTGLGGIVATPQYMSPEQASLTGLDIDTRSDVYSLGVLLYELLAGSPPFKRHDLEKAGLLEILRVIRDEEPPKPSTKLSSANACASLSASRGTEPKALAGLLRSELDWVVMKALEKDRTRRYDTPTSFAADVRRYLSGEAVLAHPPSVAYKLRKFLRKNRSPVVAASLVALALVAGVVGTSVGQYRAEQQRALAETRREQAEAAEVLAETRLGEADVAKALAETRRGEAEVSRERAMETLRAATGDDVEMLIGSRTSLGPHEHAYLEAIIRRWRDLARGGGGSAAAREVAAEGAARVAYLRSKLGDWEAAVGDYRAAVAIREGLAAEFPAEPDYRGDLATTRCNLGGLLTGLGRAADAKAEYFRAIALREALAAEHPNVPRHRDGLAAARNNLGNAHDDLKEWAEAQAEYRRAIAIRAGLAAEFPALPEYRENLAMSLSNLAVTLEGLGKSAEAAGELRKSLEIRVKLAADQPDQPRYASKLGVSRNNLGVSLKSLGRATEAESEHRLAVAIREKLVADFPNFPEHRVHLGSSYCNLAEAVRNRGQIAESLATYDKAVASLERVLRDQPGDVTARRFLGSVHWGRARAYGGLGRHGEAVKDWDRAIEFSPEEDQADLRRMRASAHAAAAKPPAELAPPPRPAQ
jgi:serine/threonine protein kinase